MRSVIQHTLLVFLLLMVTGGDLLAQKDPFPSETEDFIKALAGFMGKSQKEGKKFIEKDFGEAYLTGVYSPEQQQKIVETTNRFRDVKFSAYPEYENYIKAMIHFPTSGKGNDFFVNFHDVLYKMLDERKMKRDVNELLSSVATLMEANIFYRSGSVEWKLSNNNYLLEFDDGPILRFREGNLIGYAKGDSTRILNTRGTYDFLKERWRGESGRVTWHRAEFNPETTYATFDQYEVRIKGSSFIVDSVLFYNEYFQKPLIGELTEKILADRTGEDASYPRFESYNKRLEIKNLFENVDYDGGFTMRGSKLAGTGTTEEPAELIFYREGQPFLFARSLEFTIRPERFSSSNTAVTFKIENDSIFHPDVSMKFDRKNRELVLIRSDEGLSKGPYFNTYHEVDMRFEALYWKIDNPLIEMGSIMGSTQHFAQFESNTFFREDRYDAMMGYSMVHPLIKIRDFARDRQLDSFYAIDLANYLRLPEEQAIVMLINLANTGFVVYDINTRWATLTEKVRQYLENSSGKRDYDVLQFNSETGGEENAQLNLLNYNMLLRGVKYIQLSDSQSVTIYPAKEEVILKKNRDFKFGGRVRAGNFEFIGREYAFNYDEFKVDLIEVDSCRIYVEDENSGIDMYGNRSTSRIKNVLEEVKGTLKIDSPTNKSGTQSAVYPQYPILNCVQESYVYYDNSRIQDGVYDRDRFYYQVKPFEIDSLDNFAREDLKFNGTLVSGGIFPDITEPLGLMEDNSLGFEVSTGAGSLPLYKGKGDFTSDITLNYNGLQGNGQLDYLTSTSASEQFIFLPDSTIGRTTSFENRENRGGIEVPKARAQAVDIVFNPVDDYLAASSVEAPINFFEDEAVLDGTLKLQPKGMRGNGDMRFSGATLSSKDFDYRARKILADTSNFQLNEVGAESLAFKTDNVNADVDFDKRFGKFVSNGGETKIEFPANQYICFMDEFKWFMDKNEMELSSNRQVAEDFVIDTDEGSDKSNFYSVNELQDSLNFLSPNAIYDVKESVITCKKIQYITVADSKVIPDSGKVTIQKRAKMDPLQRATVIANYVTQYHRIFDAELNIRGRYEYDGEGDYTYVDENKKEQVVHIAKLEVDTTLQTVGTGAISEEDGFMLSPFFEFQGNFELYANNPNLTFEGGTRILHLCEEIDRDWFKFRSEIDPKTIYIPVDTNMRSIGMTKLGAGVMVADESPYDLYGSFLSRKNDRSDLPLIEATGYLFYEKKDKSYRISSIEKLKKGDLPGSLVAINTETCTITGDGQVNYDVDYGHVKVNSYGFMQHDIKSGLTSANGSMLFNFYMADPVLKHITEQLQAWPGLQPIDITKTAYERSIREIMGLEASDEVISELALSGQLKRVPKELQYTMFLADVSWEWDPVEESYITKGPLGIASLGKEQVFRYIKGKIEIQKGRSADILRIYLHFDDANWIYMEYKLGIMNITTSDKDLMSIITEMKDDKRRIKDDDGNKFTFQLVASKKKRNDFIDRFDDFD